MAKPSKAAAKAAGSKSTTAATTHPPAWAAQIATLAELLDAHRLSEIEVEGAGMRLRVSRAAAGGGTAPLAAATNTVAPAEATAATPSDARLVTSPLVGTFYRAPAPEARPFVVEGQTVKAGATLCIVEAMKVMNEVKAERALRVREVLVQNAQPVEFGAPLFQVEYL